MVSEHFTGKVATKVCDYWLKEGLVGGMSACHPSMAEEEGRVQILLQLISNSAASYSPISKHSCCLIKWDFVCI